MAGVCCRLCASEAGGGRRLEVSTIASGEKNAAGKFSSSSFNECEGAEGADQSRLDRSSMVDRRNEDRDNELSTIVTTSNGPGNRITKTVLVSPLKSA